ncbi:MAG: relaxase/mobilization nuclease domain-containing protein [Lysobacteraceae bacterium]
MSGGGFPRGQDGFDVAWELFRRPGKGSKDARQPEARRSGQSLTSFIATARRVVRRAPEVVVRITGGAKGNQHVKEHLAYITRNGKLEATNERGEKILGREAVRALASEWSDGERPPRRKSAAPDTRNLALSMPAGHDPELVLRAARTFADKAFGAERRFALVLHTDQQHPHVHLTLKTRGFDGRNLHPRRADLQSWREGFASELRALGVDAEATPRHARGVVRKAKRQPLVHMERDHAGGRKGRDGKARAPEVQLAKYQEAIRDLTGQDGPKVRPWELRIAERQKAVRRAWLGAAKLLETHPLEEARQLASDIREFVAQMPQARTERQEVKRLVAAKLRSREKDQGRG